jgi:uncharacterized protein (TIGR02246 family)
MKNTLVICASLLWLLTAGLPAAQPDKKSSGKPPAGPEARTADREAIRDVIGSLAKSFEARDAKALAAHWTAEGEYRNAQGVAVQGREALEQAFGKFFAKTPEVTAEVKPDGLRFLSRDSGIEEGTVTVRRGPANPATKARYSALVVREGEGWRLASLSESDAEEKTTIEDLSWLIGQWKSIRGEGAEIQTRYSWAPGKKFIHVQFLIKEQDLALSGSQVIGVDPATGVIHSWTFAADGGVGEADWTRDGDHWVLSAEGTLADGRSLNETNVLRRVSDDTFTWQSVDRKLDDEELADLAPVKVTRVKGEK